MSAPVNPNAQPISSWKYHDYADAGALVTGAIATGSAFGAVLTGHAEITGIAAGLTVVLDLLSRWLQGKGD